MSLFSYSAFASGKPTVKSLVGSLQDMASDSLDHISNVRRVRSVTDELDGKRSKRRRERLDFNGQSVELNVSVLMNDEMFGVEVRSNPMDQPKPLTILRGDHFRGKDGRPEPMKPYMAYLNTEDFNGPDLIHFIESNRLGRPVKRDGKPVFHDGIGGKGPKSVLYQFNPRRLYELDPDGFFYQRDLYGRRQMQSDLRNRVRFEHGHVEFDTEGFDPLKGETTYPDLDMDF